ncbi:MAG: glycosyltransferase family 2 protein [Nostocaceae cyanobacterium]|nr:glycosyltransferase family 2 protein [Nostocaceae cyanobacterium]
MNQNLVSIGMPLYNAESFLKEALDSILNQSFEDFELIISDNGSTDKTAEICQEYAAKDERIRYYRHEQNRGAAWNFNYVFNLAQGKYFKWAADDDVCAANFLECCVEVLENEQSVVLSYPKTIFTKADGEKWWEGTSIAHLDSWKSHERYQAAITDFWCLAVFGLMRTDVLRKTSLIAPYYGSDKQLLVELSLMGRFQEVPEYLFFRRCHSDQSSRLSPQEREVWIDPTTVGRPKLLRHRGSIGYLRAIFKAKLSWKERIVCLNVLRQYVFSLKVWKNLFIQRTPSKVEEKSS